MAVIGDVNMEFWEAEDPTTRQGSYRLQFYDSWFHITEMHGWHDLHDHGALCSWCGIYYLDTGNSSKENGGMTRFRDPRIKAQHKGYDYATSYLQDSLFDIEPREGALCIFPSYLEHSVLPYSNEKQRVTIAFNAGLRIIKDKEKNA